MSRPIADLARSAQAGDERALTALLVALEPLLKGIVRRWARGSASNVDELTVIAHTAVWEAVRSWDASRPFLPYARTIVAREVPKAAHWSSQVHGGSPRHRAAVASGRLAAARIVTVDGEALDLRSDIDPEEALFDRIELTELFAHLGPEEERLLRLLQEHGYSTREVGAMLGCSHVTVLRKKAALLVRLRRLAGVENPEVAAFAA